MKLLVFRCANGVVIFRIFRIGKRGEIAFHCVTDGSNGRVFINSDADVQHQIELLAQKVIALKGAIQQFTEINI